MDCSTIDASTIIKGFKGNSITLKVILIMALILILIIPKEMMISLVSERMERGEEAIAEIGSKWGSSQTFSGPLLTIPATNKDGDILQCHIYPETLHIDTQLQNNELQRGIFKAILYNADIQVTARFRKPSKADFNLPSNSQLLLDQAYISFGVSDVKGIAKDIDIQIDDSQETALSGLPANSAFKAGFHIPANLQETEKIMVIKATIPLKGSEAFNLLPSGKSSTVKMASNWPDPSFNGDFLPTERQINEKGFSATWNVHALQKSSIHSWIGKSQTKSSGLIGVNLIEANGFYQKILRIIKYAILFLCFTFAAVFISERLIKMNIHPLQYMLTGIASLLFYVLLLSLAEHIDFNTSYLITASLITLLITAYGKGIFKASKVAFTLGSVTASLYLFLFVTLQMEDYALLMGSSGLFAILAIVMYLTRNINKEGSAMLQHT